MRQLRTHKKTAWIGHLLLTAALITFSVVAASAQGDILIRDCSNDGGTVPSVPNNCSDYYFSPDLWVRLAPDGGTVHQTPIANQTCYVYVRVKNIGNGPLCGVVHAYFTEAGTSLANWPVNWINFYVGGILRGDEIGAECVCVDFHNQVATVMIPWKNPPANSNSFRHYCLLTRFTSFNDPMQNTEQISAGYNVNYNNNIAQRNLDNISPSNRTSVISVANGRANAQPITLKFKAIDDEGNGNVFDIPGFRPKVTLGAELFAAWQATGGEGDGIEVDQADAAIVITQPEAEIRGINLQGRDCNNPAIFDVQVDFEFNNDGNDQPRYWAIEQYDEEGGDDVPINGQAFAIWMNDEVGGKTVRRPTFDLGGKLDLGAQPNFSKGETSISFTLPRDGRITLAIYDAAGHLVRTLIGNESQSAGHHEVIWNGASESGAQVANGTYFYRLVTPEGTAEDQIKIVR